MAPAATEELIITPIGAQIVVEVRQGGQSGQVVVHWEQNNHSGVSCPAFANDRVATIVRQAAALMHDAANAIARQVPAEGV